MSKKILAICILAILLTALAACNPSYKEVTLQFKNVAYQDIDADSAKISVTYQGTADGITLDGTTLKLSSKADAGAIKGSLAVTYDGEECLVYQTKSKRGKLTAEVIVGAEVDTPQTVTGKLMNYAGAPQYYYQTKVLINGKEVATVDNTGAFAFGNIFGEVEVEFKAPSATWFIHNYLYRVGDQEMAVTAHSNSPVTYKAQVVDTAFNAIKDVRMLSNRGEIVHAEYVDDFLFFEMHQPLYQRGYYVFSAAFSEWEMTCMAEGYNLVKKNASGAYNDKKMYIVMAESDKNITEADEFLIGGRIAEWYDGGAGIEDADIYINDVFAKSTDFTGNFDIVNLFEPVRLRLYKEGYEFYHPDYGIFEEIVIGEEMIGFVARCRPKES